MYYNKCRYSFNYILWVYSILYLIGVIVATTIFFIYICSIFLWYKNIMNKHTLNNIIEMKKIVSLWLSFWLTSVLVCFGQNVRVLDIESPGALSMQLSYNDLEEITDLTLMGKMNAKDFGVIGLYMNNLKVLNLMDVTIEGYTGSTNPQVPATVYRADEMPPKAFLNKKYLTSIVLPRNLTGIGESAFAGCMSLPTIVLPPTLRVIGEKAFEGCIGLRSLDIPKSVVSIEGQAFYNCSGLSDVKFNEGLQTIGRLAFGNCISLETIRLPYSLTEIGESAFAHCKKLKHIYVRNPEPIRFDENTEGPYAGVYKQITLHVPANSVEKYSSACVWDKLKHIRPAN